MKFNVYSVGWYVDAKALQQDQRFLPFYDKTYESLKNSSEFNMLMTKPGGYDRSLFIKLAMTLKKDMVLQGLVEELQISRKNAVSRYYPVFCFMSLCLILSIYFSKLERFIKIVNALTVWKLFSRGNKEK